MSRLSLAPLLLLVASPTGEAPQVTKPAAFEARGKLLCLSEEMKSLHNADVPPVHDHLWGIRLETPKTSREEEPKYVVLLRTPMSEALFADERFRANELVLTGRIFPGTTLFEVSRTRWMRDGKLRDVYYWCEICSIRTVSPAACACCQGKVELREAVADESRR